MIKADYVTVGDPNGLANRTEESISVYPNPGTGKVRVIGFVQAESAVLRIYNMLGELVYESHNADLSKDLDLSGLKKGSYFLRLENDGKIYTTRFSLVQ